MHVIVHSIASFPRAALVFIATYVAGLVSWALLYRRER
jgi:hypothetical protein